MIAAPARRAFTLGLLGVVAIGAVALTGLWHPNAPEEAMQVYLPAITLPTVVVAAAIDGINPCAFTVLLLFITALLATLPAGPQEIRAARFRLLCQSEQPGAGSRGALHRRGVCRRGTDDQALAPESPGPLDPDP